MKSGYFQEIVILKYNLEIKISTKIAGNTRQKEKFL